jgi:ketosteroid isomerase-like protein
MKNEIDGTGPLTGLDNHEQALHAFYAAFNGRDLDAMARCWLLTGEASLDNPLGGIRRGWNAIEPLYRALFEGPARVYVAFYEYTIHSCGDGFVAVGRERGQFERSGVSVPLAIRTSRVFRREGGRWQQLHHHGSIDDPVLLERYQRAVLGQ